MKRRTRKERKRLFLISLTIILLLVSFAASIYNNFMQILNNKREIMLLTKEYEDLLDTEKILASEVTKMQDPNYVARYAKEKYLYSEKDEVIIRFD